MKIKIVFGVSLVLLTMIASVTMAQVPCGPTVTPPRTLAVNWPQLAFDAAHTACNPYESILSPATVGNLILAWKYPTQAGWSPVLANGVVYIGDGGGTLYALNATTGAPLWTYEVQGEFCLAPPAVANGLVYFGCYRENGPSNGIYALDASTGVLRWSFGAGTTSSLTVANGVLYYGENVGGFFGRLTALNASSGAFLWGYSAGLNATAPAVANGIVYFGSDDRNVYALNASTGTLIWKAQGGGTAYVGPIADGRVYVGAGYGVSAYNASTGALIWVKATFTLAGGIAHGVLYAVASNPNPGLYALNASTGEVIWRFALGGPYLAVANGVVYSPDGDQNLYALDANTGAQLWDYQSQYYGSSPAVANGMVYIGTDSGLLAFHLPGR